MNLSIQKIDKNVIFMQVITDQWTLITSAKAKITITHKKLKPRESLQIRHREDFVVATRVGILPSTLNQIMKEANSQLQNL